MRPLWLEHRGKQRIQARIANEYLRWLKKLVEFRSINNYIGNNDFKLVLEIRGSKGAISVHNKKRVRVTGFKDLGELPDIIKDHMEELYNKSA